MWFLFSSLCKYDFHPCLLYRCNFMIHMYVCYKYSFWSTFLSICAVSCPQLCNLYSWIVISLHSSPIDCWTWFSCRVLLCIVGASVSYIVIGHHISHNFVTCNMVFCNATLTFHVDFVAYNIHDLVAYISVSFVCQKSKGSTKQLSMTIPMSKSGGSMCEVRKTCAKR